jgi:orotidine-5'-phosphate decarboxylase
VTDADRLEAARGRIIVALDVATASAALKLAGRLKGRAGLVKVGSQLFTAVGPEVVRALVARGERVFLDLKFHDIPSIVAEACANAARMGVDLVTVHTAGGPRMLRAARAALEKHARRGRRPRLLGVTLLTSLSGREVRQVGLAGGVEANVVRLVRLARRSGCDGVIAAPTDVAGLRRGCGRDFLIVTPGIRARGGRKASDQARVATAADAIRAGADYVVVGRAILEARSPVAALEQLAEEIATALD